MVSHTLWDGAIFLVGVWLVRLFCRPPILEGFHWAQLALLVAWGQVTAFLVEFSSGLNGGWVFVEGYLWNPTLFRIGDHPITLLMQLTWFFASIAFYLVAIRQNAAWNEAGSFSG